MCGTPYEMSVDQEEEYTEIMAKRYDDLKLETRIIHHIVKKQNESGGHPFFSTVSFSVRYQELSTYSLPIMDLYAMPAQHTNMFLCTALYIAQSLLIDPNLIGTARDNRCLILAG